MEAARTLLIRELEGMGLPASSRVVSLFMTYLAELKRWNRAYNLTALRTDDEIIAKHFLDSLLYLHMIGPDCRDLCDIGSGAGFPGLPLAVVRPALRVTLIEPSRKKCAFLRHLVRKLALENVSVVERRVEEVEEVFDAAVSRALFTIGDLVKKAGRVLREGGYFVVSKGPGLREETAALPEGVEVKKMEVSLPATGVTRYLVKVVPGRP